MKKFVIWSILLCPMFFLLMGFQEQKNEQTRQEALSKLNWLIGQWVDKYEDIDLNLSYSWDENKNFLINEFSIQDKTSKIFDGKQIITWDPAKNKVRSWLFDSEGGFGQGEWQQKGDKWIVQYVQTMRSGEIASSTNIYKKVNQDSYTYESIDRMVGGEMLPDIDEVTVVRKK